MRKNDNRPLLAHMRRTIEEIRAEADTEIVDPAAGKTPVCLHASLMHVQADRLQALHDELLQHSPEHQLQQMELFA